MQDDDELRQKILPISATVKTARVISENMAAIPGVTGCRWGVSVLIVVSVVVVVEAFIAVVVFRGEETFQSAGVSILSPGSNTN